MRVSLKQPARNLVFSSNPPPPSSSLHKHMQHGQCDSRKSPLRPIGNECTSGVLRAMHAHREGLLQSKVEFPEDRTTASVKFVEAASFHAVQRPKEMRPDGGAVDNPMFVVPTSLSGNPVVLQPHTSMTYGPIVFIPRLTPMANREVSSSTFLLQTNFSGVENFVVRGSSEYLRLALDTIQWTNTHGAEGEIRAADLCGDSPSCHLAGNGGSHKPKALLTNSGGVVGYTVVNTGAIDVRVMDVKIDGRSCASAFAQSHLTHCSDLPLRITPGDRATFTLTQTTECLAARSETVVTFVISEHFTSPLEVVVGNVFTTAVIDDCLAARDLSTTATCVLQTLLLTVCLLVLAGGWSRYAAMSTDKPTSSGDLAEGCAQNQSRDRGTSRDWVDVRARLAAARKGVAPSKMDMMVGRTLPNLLDVKVSAGSTITATTCTLALLSCR